MSHNVSLTKHSFVALVVEGMNILYHDGLPSYGDGDNGL
jgi:hypothetical protein